MAKFCTKCGKELVEGKSCNCTYNKVEVTNETSIVNQILNIVKGMLIAPIDTMKSFIQENNFNNALISLGVSAVAVAIFICVLCKEMFEPLLELAGISNQWDLYGTTVDLEIPYVKIALISILVAMATYALIAGIAYLISAKLLKNETSYKKLITWLGANAGLLTVVYLVAAVCLFIHFQIALLVYTAGMILNLCYMYKGLQYACNTEENKLAYVLMPALLITCMIIGYLVPKIMV